MKDELSPRGCGVDVLLKGFEANSPFPQIGNRIYEVAKRPAKPIEPPHNKGISFSKVAESLCKPFSFSFGT